MCVFGIPEQEEIMRGSFKSAGFTFSYQFVCTSSEVLESVTRVPVVITVSETVITVC
jgi:hypothetical protein